MICDIRDFGAVTTDILQTKAIQKAIDTCFLAGGGEVHIPCGIYRTGGLRLRSNVVLYLESGAILEGSQDPEEYFHWREDGIEPIYEKIEDEPARYRSAYCYSRWNNALIRAIRAENAAIIGEPGSYIDGCNPFDPVGEERYRGPHGINMWYCKNITLKGYTIRNSGNWNHAIFQCEKIRMDNVTVMAGHDGADFFLCRDVLVENSHFYSGDDAIAGFGSKDVTIRDSELNTACSILRFGGTDVRIERCWAVGPGKFCHRYELSRKEQEESRMGTDQTRHNTLSVFLYYCDERFGPLPFPQGNIKFVDCRFENVEDLFNMAYGLHRWCSHSPLLSIGFQNCQITGLHKCSFLHGDPEHPTQFTLENVKLSPAPGFENTGVLDAENFEKIVLKDVDCSGYRSPHIIQRSEGEILLSNTSLSVKREAAGKAPLHGH